MLIHFFWKLAYTCVFWSFNEWIVSAIQLFWEQIIEIFCCSIKFNIQNIIRNIFCWKCLITHIGKTQFGKIRNYWRLWSVINIFRRITYSLDFFCYFHSIKFKSDVVSNFKLFSICKAFVKPYPLTVINVQRFAFNKIELGYRIVFHKMQSNFRVIWKVSNRINNQLPFHLGSRTQTVHFM